MYAQDLPVKHVGHRTLLMRQVAAIRAVQLVRTAEPLVGIANIRTTAPQLYRPVAAVRNDARGIAGIDGYRVELDRSSVARLELLFSLTVPV